MFMFKASKALITYPPSIAVSSYKWADSEVRIFLEEWEVVERRVGNPGRKVLEKSWAIRQQINERRGLKKNWESCVFLLYTLQNLHRTLCSGRTVTLPLFSPYSQALYRILGHSPGSSCSPWADSEIRIFLEEWERVERRVGNPGRKISEKSLALSLQLNEQRGLKKNWESCVLLMRTLQNLHRRLCSGRPEAVPLFSPYSEALYRILGRPPDPSCSPWVDYEIRIFLQEWEGVERRDGSPGKQALEKSWALYKRLNEQRGLKKSWDSCFHLLLNLQNLHRTLCNERPETVPLFSPYSEALYRILGRPPGPLCRDGSGMRLLAKNPQPPMNRPSDSGSTVPLTQLQENPLLMKSWRNSLFPRWDTLKHSHPSPFPRLPPA
ncbi:Putative uncharacterized protein MSANTD5 [Lemmus lemmus]